MFSLISAMFIWGTLGVFALWSGLHAVDLAFIRCVIGGMLLFVYCSYKGEFNSRMLSKSLLLAVMSGLFIVLNWVLLFKSFQLASITIGNVSYYLQPIFLVVLGSLFLNEKVNAVQWGFILLTTFGVLLTSDLNFAAFDGRDSLLLGTLAAVMAGVLYSMATLVIKYIADIPPSLLTLIQLLIGSLILLPQVHFSHFYSMSEAAWLNALTIGVVHTALAYILYYQSLKKVTMTLIAVVSYLDPIVAIFTDVMFFNRHLGAMQYIGILLTFVGSYFVIRLKAKPVEAFKQPAIEL